MPHQERHDSPQSTHCHELVCALDKVEKKAALKELGSIYRAPTTSASPLHKRPRSRMIVTSQFDAPENRNEWLDSSHSKHVAAAAVCTGANECPMTNGQLYDRRVRRIERTCQLKSLELLEKTKPSDNTTVSASFEHVSISWRTVSTPPQMNGKGDRVVCKPRVKIISRNEEALKALAENLAEWIQDPATSLIFSDDDGEKLLPAVARVEHHTREKIKTSEEVCSDITMSWTTVSVDDF
jgi:hypothetical protein